MRGSPLIVLKFGSSVLRDDSDFPRTVHEIYRWVRAGHRVVAVVSALQNATDELLERAQALDTSAAGAALSALLATGEAAAAALLSLALTRAGVPAIALDEVRLGLRTRGPVLDAEPCSIDAQAVLRALEHTSVVVVPGFVGRHDDGSLSLLGRGGSDLSALFVAHELQAEQCRLIKDVDGIFDRHPTRASGSPRRYRTLSWADAQRIGDGVVQRKALAFAERHGLSFEVAALNSDQPSRVGDQRASFYEESCGRRPLRVGLLGAGTVGLGVYRRLAASPELFEITNIAVRKLEREDGTPRALLTQDPWRVIDSDCDLVVELIGGLSPAKELIAAALRAGKHVITANKMVIAHHGREFRRLAEENGVQLLYSAAVGGAAPMLEQVQRIAVSGGVRSLRGVVNGTTNFILDRLAEGQSGEEAVRAAQQLGLAEADPTTDLNGSDAAHKLALLAHTAFGSWLHPAEIERSGIEAIERGYVRQAAQSGRAVRLVASLDRVSHDVRASVRPVLVDRDHAFAKTCNEENCLEIHADSGEVVYVRGKGAGRWPATESVIADVLDLCRANQSVAAESCIAAGSAL